MTREPEEISKPKKSLQERAQEFRANTAEAYAIFIHELPRRMRLALRWLIALTALAVLTEGLFRFALPDPEKRAYTNQDILREVRLTAQTLAERVTKLRDLIASDNTIREGTSQEQNGMLFTRLFDIKKQFDDSLATFIQQEDAPAPEEQYSVALYNPNRKLVAWSSTTPLRSPWDSALVNAHYIEHKSRAIFVERRGDYVWLIGLRRISDTASEGFVMSRALLAYAPGDKLRNVQSFDFLSPVARRVQHVLNIDYERQLPPGAMSREPYAIIAERDEPATFLGTIRIGEATIHEMTGIRSVVIAIRELLSAALIYFLIGSIIYVLIRRPALKESASIRFQTCEVVVVLFVTGRVALMALGNFGSLLPDAARDTDLFAIADLAGIAGNPLELFLTAMSLAVMVALIARIVSLSNGPKHATLPFWKFTLYFLSFLAIELALIYVLKTVLLGVITNSTLSLYPIKQAIPDLAELCIYFTIILIGFIYCIAATTALVWFLTSSIPLLRLENYEVLIGRGIALLIVLLLFAASAVLLYAPPVGLLLSKYFWLLVTIPLVAITGMVWLSQLKPAANDPRSRFSITSGLAILVFVSGGSIIASPLAASLEFGNKVTILEVASRPAGERAFEYAARLEAAFMEFGQEREMMDTDRTRIAQHFSNERLRLERTGIRAIAATGKTILSQYGQLLSPNMDVRLAAYADSLLRSEGGSGSPYLVRMISGDSVSFAAFPENIIIGILCLDSPRSNGGDFLAVVISPSAENALSAASEVQKENEIIKAVYEDNILRETSNPSLNLPSHLPPETDKRILATRSPAEMEIAIEGKRYFFIVYPAHERTTIVSGMRIPDLTNIFEIALHIHFLGILLAILFSILNFIARAFFASEQQVLIRFRERILLIVIALAFIPLILVTNVTRSLLVEREVLQKRERLIADAGAVTTRLREQTGGVRDTASAGRILRETASTLHRSIQLYDNRGLLRLTSDESLVKSGFINTALDAGAVKDMFIGGKTFTLDDTPVGATTIVRSAFQILPQTGNHQSGIIAVRDIDAAFRIEESIASTISFIYGVFAAVAALLLLVGALFAYLLSRPISKVIQATEEVAGGAYGVVVPIDRNDEMGDLANAFNRMSHELDRSRERLAQSEREVAWKEMARQVAHEIKNPLTPMKLSVQHVEHAYETKDENFAAIFRRVMRTLSEQIAVLTRIATEFSRFGEMPRRRYSFVALKNVTESAVALFDAERGRIRFVIDIPDNLSAIYADEEEFRRSLVNLIRNAVQAIDQWGAIIITAKEHRGLIHITITDTGAGITKETLAKIFDPNFSTKTSGMGLGLAIVKRSITDMSGQISVESEAGKGTTFHIDLPAREFPAAG